MQIKSRGIEIKMQIKSGGIEIEDEIKSRGIENKNAISRKPKENPSMKICVQRLSSTQNPKAINPELASTNLEGRRRNVGSRSPLCRGRIPISQ